MTDRQKLVYDLSMQLTAAELAKGIPLSENPAAYALDTLPVTLRSTLQWIPPILTLLLLKSKRCNPYD